LFVLALLPLLTWNLYRTHGKKYKAYTPPLLLILPPLVFGVYWYVKNYVLYGSPLYPFGLQVAGISIFPGMNFQQFAATAVQSTALPHSCAARIWFVWTEQKDWFGCLYNYDTNYAGFGPIWFIVLLPALLVSVYVAIKKRSAMYVGVLASVVALFAIYPSNYYSRYTIFITSIGVIALAVTLSNISRLTSIIVRCTTLALILSVIGTNFVLCNFPPATVRAQLKSVLAGSQRGAIYSGFPGAAFVFMEDRVRPKQVVAYDSKPYFIYPLWNPDFSDTVIYLPAKSKADWYQQLSSRHVAYVFTTLHSKENGWATGTLKEVYKDDMYEVFQTH
jgi:hypothetical protein